jgi:aldehyde dehydrogenase (NAD+)
MEHAIQEVRMATVATSTPEPIPLRPALLDERLKRMLINGPWVETASGKTFDRINPSPGETLASIAEGDAEDINRAVTAARRAFEGPWSQCKPYERQHVILRLADLIEQHFEACSVLDTLDMGALLRGRGSIAIVPSGASAMMPPWPTAKRSRFADYV